MPKRCKSRQDVIEAAKTMPPLYHKLPNQTFDFRQARTLWWLVKQTAVLKYVWEIVKQSGAVTYDARTGKWQGIDFETEEVGNDEE